MPPTAAAHPTLDPEFLHDYEQERLRWLRIRFLWYAGLLGGLWGAAGIAVAAIVLAGLERPEGVGLALATAALLKAALFLVPFARVLRSRAIVSRERILRLVFWMILGYSLVQFIPARIFAGMLTQSIQNAGATRVELGAAVPIVLQTLLIHFITSLLIPWTPREALRPILPFMAVAVLTAFIAVAAGDSSADTIPVVLIVMGAIVAPGLLVCKLRQSRFARSFENRAVRARYGELRHELSTARRIHDRLFPAPITTGPVRLDFVYEPMRHIGGDFLFVGADLAPPSPAAHAERPLSVLLIDVTGHGIAAALAVNRLHGELARIFGSEADASPGRVLAELNRYIHLTMSRDTVFATALCLSVDPERDTITWANAGHPPALLRAADGRISRLASTTFLLGAAHPDEFDPSEESAPFTPGDTVLAYTDGAIEARLRGGGMIGLEGLEALAVAHAPTTAAAGDWCAAVLNAIKAQRDGPAEDDTLLVRIARPPGSPRSPSTPSPATPSPATPSPPLRSPLTA